MRMFMLAGLLLFCAPAFADIVVFKNGDRLSGKVVHKLGPELVFETAHSGTLNIQWSEISTLGTDEPVAVMLRNDDAVSNETLAADAGGNAVLTGSGRGISLDNIAYINPDPEQSGIGVNYKGRATLAASDTRGNTTGRRLYADAQFVARARDYRYNLGAKVNHQRESGVKTASNWAADGNYDWFLEGERYFRYVRGSLEHDRFKDIELRSTAGAGYGIQLVEDDRTDVSIRGGLDYLTVNHYADENESYPALGWGIRASHRLQKSDVELFHEQDGYLQIADGNNLTLRTRTGLRAPITDSMNASVQLNLDWEKEPAPGRKATDSVFLVGLGYDW